jgi:murein DD-endopeptidase MepM/ murein hydrolase activator NlpD
MKKTLFVLAALLLIPTLAHAQLQLNLDYPSFGGFDLNQDQQINSVVAWFYYLIVGISGFAAFTMLVWGGISWLSSAGSPARITDAKDRIRNALLGLLLVLGSFIILQILNPELTILRSPELTEADIPAFQRTPQGASSGVLANTASCNANESPTSLSPQDPFGSPVGFTVTDPFGINNALYFQGLRSTPCHTGIDIGGANAGQTIYAAGPGIVTWASVDGSLSRCGGYGLSVIVDHGDYKTRYAHLESMFTFAGQSISRGDRIGLVGSSGCTDGAHLHYEVISKQSSLQQNVNNPVWGVCGSQRCTGGASVNPVK